MLSLQKLCLQLSDLINLKLNIKEKKKKKDFWTSSVKKAKFQKVLNVYSLTTILSKMSQGKHMFIFTPD